jgi:hypothetical protein
VLAAPVGAHAAQDPNFVDEPETVATFVPDAYDPTSDTAGTTVTTDKSGYRTWDIGGCPVGAYPVLQQWYPGATTKVWGEPAQMTWAHYMSYGNAYYWKCPGSATRLAKIKFYAYKFCASKTQGDAPSWPHSIRGFWYNPYFAGPSGAVVNPGQVQLDWDGHGDIGEEHCTKKFGISKDNRVWMVIESSGASPWWEVGGHIDQAGMLDPNFNFDFTGNRHYVPWPNDTRMLQP